MFNTLVVNSIVISDHEKNARAHSWLMPIHLWFTCVLNHLGNKVVSSANKWKSKKLEQWWKSLMYNKKKIGPRTDPWGTPHEISTGIKVTPFTVTVCRRFARLWAKPLICNVTYVCRRTHSIFFNDISWFMVWNALLKSKIYHKKNPSRQLPFEFYQQY